MRWVPMVVEGVRRCGCDAAHPLVALSEPDGDRWCNVRVSGPEADHLAHELAGQRTRAAVTYSLIEELLSALGWSLCTVRLNVSERQEVLALVEVGRNGERAGVRAHAGDAVLLASRAKITIDVPVELARLGDRGLAERWLPDEDLDELVDFRGFLDRVTPQDFAP